ncbi:acyltransferase family protein [Bosea sp. RAF48]|uniref:acyltransferase family protein n=1 Tax=Bosea sp. RAF48 TaxID=3237480 RepID=UPI003F91F859
MQGRLENVQALRGFAALAVVVAHLGGLYAVDPSIPKIEVRAGVAGVDIFFVLSGFIIAWITRDEGWSANPSFIANRFWRVFPLYWLLTLPELPWASIIAYARDGYLFPNWDYYLKSALLIPAFSPGSTLLYPALNPGWTLFYELAFYLIWFGLMVGSRRQLLVRLTAALLALYASGWVAAEESPWRAFATNSVLFEFAFGVAIAEITLRRTRALMSAPVAVAAIAVSILAIIALDHFLDTNYRLLTFGVPAAAILLATLDLQRAGKIAPRLLCFIGDASYAIYLAQAGMIAAITKLLAPTSLVWPLKLMLIAGSAVAVGVILHWAFERPIMDWRKRVRRGSRVPSEPDASPQKSPA